MNERVAKLRQQSVETKPCISSERAELMTAFYQSDVPLRESVPVCRALAFKHLMENKTICINDGELIVGEKGPAPKATPTYPELCCHSLQDLQILNDREKTAFAVGEEVRRVYREKIIPFWSGKTMREKIFQAMDEAWLAAYEAGMFTEFMEQRSPGHTVLDNKIYRKGMLDFKQDIQRSLDGLDYLNDPQAYAKQEELKAMLICADAVIRFAERHAEKARELARHESDPQRKAELQRIAEVCSHVPAHAPRDFWEALQYYWFVHLGVTTEMNPWDSFCPGRLDQHLYPFYKKGLDEGTLDARAGRGIAPVLLDQVQQSAGPAQGGRHRRRERHLHRLRPDQQRRPERGRLRRRQRRDLPGPRRDRGNAARAAQFLDPGQQEEPGPVHQAGGPNHPHRLRPALGLQHRPDRPGADPHGQVRRRRPQRRLQRLRRGRRLRQGSLHPDRLLQPAQGAGTDPQQRRGPAEPASRSALRPATPSSSAPSSSSSKPTAGSSTT